jgi:hypothetical protein
VHDARGGEKREHVRERLAVAAVELDDAGEEKRERRVLEEVLLRALAGAGAASVRAAAAVERAVTYDGEVDLVRAEVARADRRRLTVAVVGLRGEAGADDARGERSVDHRERQQERAGDRCKGRNEYPTLRAGEERTYGGHGRRGRH